MFEVKQPFYNVDVDGGGWDFSPAAETADDVQPEMDTDAEALEEEVIAGEHEVEPGTDDGDEETEEQDDQEGQPAFNDDTEVDLGNGTQPVKLGELKQGFMRQSDYTKKTQALSDERKSFESERAEWEPAKGLNDFLSSNPWLATKINQFVQEFTQTGQISLEDALEDGQYGQYINSLMAERNTLSKKVQELEGKTGELEFTGNMRDLKATLREEYSDLFSEDYFTTLQERGKTEKLPTSVLKEVADAHFTKLKLQQVDKQSKKATREAQAKTVQSLHEKRTSLPANPKKTGQVPKAATKSIEDMSWDEMFRAN